eukprot:TRINITY_DN37952_c0_g1_i1.p1 TRINITY_DN37952_c0_g1~~TRINITY_DN37952_c0_g1_i1.p1  ORF type:complete len:1128 (+),score=279.02 TRINITY_DN37952_c0_g1_i1:61-3444(+)
MAAQCPNRQHAATFKVDGMTCGACSGTVERALQAAAGVSSASVSCVTHLAHVQFDPSVVAVEELVDTVDMVGFDATLVEEQAAKDEEDVEAGRAKTGPTSVELAVGGMTCSACSGTVERLLQNLKGVERATVSLVLHRAFVTLASSSAMTAEDLVEEIEMVGFDASVVAVSSADALGGPSQGCGRAQLHVQLGDCGSTGSPKAGSRSPDAKMEKSKKSFAAELDAFCRDLEGVLGCQATTAGHRRVVYNPHKIGGRTLLERLRERMADRCPIDWISVSAESEHLLGFVKEMDGLRSDMWWALPPAAMVFMLTILLPSLGIEEHQMSLLSMQLHHGLDLCTLLVLLLATPVQFCLGRRFHLAAAKALKRGSPNMDVLVSVATNTAYFYSLTLIVFCIVTPETSSSHYLTMATGHFLTMGPILIAVVLSGKFMEAKAKLKAMEALTDLPSSQPSTAVLCTGSGESAIPVELVELGDILRVYAGAKVPVDGIICSENSVHVDESLMTGESIPVPKDKGSLVLGGTLCLSGGFLMRVTKVGCETTLGQMVQLVEGAQASKAQVQRVADRVARVFVPSIVLLSVLTAAIWAFLVFTDIVEVPVNWHAPGGHGGHGGDMGHMHIDGAQMQPAKVDNSLKFLFAMKFGMAVLMIACPCAMGLATPMAIMVATGVAAKRGCLVKSAEALESTALLDVVVLDKTGTVTKGAPAIRAACILPDVFAGPHAQAWNNLAQSGQAASKGASSFSPPGVVLDMLAAENAQNPLRPADIQACFWWLLGTLESTSDHPLAKCISTAVLQVEGLPPIIPPTDFEYISGRGAKCSLEALGGAVAGVGNVRFLEEAQQAASKSSRSSSDEKRGNAEMLKSWVATMQEQGNTVVIAHVDAEPVGAVALQDPVRDDAAWVVNYLRSVLRLEVWMCTGDNTATAQSIAREVGIQNVIAEALPTTKGDCVEHLQKQRGKTKKRRVAFVGDGMNDSLALALADVGIAIGVGAQVAVESADVALVRSELSDCVTFFALGRSTFRTIILNFFWAFCFNFVCLPMAAGVFYPAVYIPPLVAGVGMACSSLLVVASSLMLRRFKPPAHSDALEEKMPLAMVGLLDSQDTPGPLDTQVLGRRIQSALAGEMDSDAA